MCEKVQGYPHGEIPQRRKTLLRGGSARDSPDQFRPIQEKWPESARNAGRIPLGRVAGFTSEQWPVWPRNGGRIGSEYATAARKSTNAGRQVWARSRPPPSPSRSRETGGRKRAFRWRRSGRPSRAGTPTDMRDRQPPSIKEETNNERECPPSPRLRRTAFLDGSPAVTQKSQDRGRPGRPYRLGRGDGRMRQEQEIGLTRKAREVDTTAFGENVRRAVRRSRAGLVPKR